MENKYIKRSYIKSSEIIRKNRLDMGMTQKDLSKKLGVSSTTVNKIENNTTGLRPEVVAELEECLNLSEEESSDLEFYEAYRSSHPIIQAHCRAQDDYIAYLEKQLIQEISVKELVKNLEKSGWTFSIKK